MEYEEFVKAKHEKFLEVKDSVPIPHVKYLQKRPRLFFVTLNGNRIHPSSTDLEACYIVAAQRKAELDSLIASKEAHDKQIAESTPAELLETYNKAKEKTPFGDPVNVRDFLKQIDGYGWDYKFMSNILLGLHITSVDFLSPKQVICVNRITQKVLGKDFAEIDWEN